MKFDTQNTLGNLLMVVLSLLINNLFGFIKSPKDNVYFRERKYKKCYFLLKTLSILHELLNSNYLRAKLSFSYLPAI